MAADPVHGLTAGYALDALDDAEHARLRAAPRTLRALPGGARRVLRRSRARSRSPPSRPRRRPHSASGSSRWRAPSGRTSSRSGRAPARPVSSGSSPRSRASRRSSASWSGTSRFTTGSGREQHGARRRRARPGSVVVSANGQGALTVAGPPARRARQDLRGVGDPRTARRRGRASSAAADLGRAPDQARPARRDRRGHDRAGGRRAAADEPADHHLRAGLIPRAGAAIGPMPGVVRTGPGSPRGPCPVRVAEGRECLLVEARADRDVAHAVVAVLVE